MSIKAVAARINAVLPAPTLSWHFATLAITFAVLGLAAIYADTVQGMVSIWWRSETFTHAFLVAPISLWLIWEKRAVLARYQPRPALWLALPLAALGFGWLLGELAAVNAVTQLAWVAMVILTVPLIIGIPAARQITFPLLFLLFAVPIGEFVMPKFMEWTATMTVFGLRASGIPVYQEGLQFVIPSGRWSVVEACSGVRYLIASLTVGTLFAYLNYQSTKRRLIFILVSLLVPIVANWVRAYIIVMLGHLSGNEIAAGADHLIYGWVFFGVVIMIMFAIGMRWREDENQALPVSLSKASDASATQQKSQSVARRIVSPIMLAAFVLAIGLLPYGALKLVEAQNSLTVPTLSLKPLAIAGWREAATDLPAWQPSFPNPSLKEMATFSKAAHQVSVQVFYYRQQGYDRKLISSENTLVKSSDTAWLPIARGVQEVKIAGQSFVAKSAILQQQSALGSSPMQFRVVHWYWIDGQYVSNDHLGKLWLAWAKLRGRGDDAAAIFVYSKVGALDEQTALNGFIADTGRALADLLAQTRHVR
ncbi:MAG: exosortase A [Rhodocyclales bacterium]|nr:exosortase A [Rhodocyclales bacterium]